MTAYHLVGLSFVVMTVGSLMSYSEAAKARWWFPWAMVSFGVCNYWLWSLAARWTPDRRELYTVSVAWDVATLVSYSLLPLAVMGVRLSLSAWLGFALVLLGTVLIKRG